MKKIVVCIVLSALVNIATAQNRYRPAEMIVPVFKDRADSVVYATTNALLMDRYAMMPVLSNPTDSLGKLRLQKFRDDNDSLNSVLRTLWMKTSGTMTIYLPKYDVWDTVSATRRPALTRISFTGRSSSLPDEILECKNLETLQIVNASVRVIRNLSKLPNLKKIEISSNSRKFRFRKNTALQEVIVRNNEKGRTPAKFGKLRSLERLDLSRSGTTKFPNIYRNKNLKSITLAGNEITLERLRNKKQTSLEVIDLRSNKIKRVPGSIGNFPSLVSLSFSTNSIESIGDGFERLTKLEYLILYSNNLSAIPNVIFRLPSLHHLDLNYNRLQRVEDGLTGMTALTDLYLAHNEINHLPDSLGRLANLRGLYLNNNHLSSLPESTGRITGLKELRLSGNYIGTLPSAIHHLQNLSWLDVSRNELKSLPEEIFQRSNLDILSLYGNPWDARMLEQMPAWVELLRQHKTSVVTSPPNSED